MVTYIDIRITGPRDEDFNHFNQMNLKFYEVIFRTVVFDQDRSQGRGVGLGRVHWVSVHLYLDSVRFHNYYGIISYCDFRKKDAKALYFPKSSRFQVGFCHEKKKILNVHNFFQIRFPNR